MNFTPWLSKIWHDPVFSKVIATGIVGIFMFPIGVWVGRLNSEQTRIREVDDVAAPEYGLGRQDVTVAVQPPPASGEMVQFWIKQGNSKWNRCGPARRLADNAFWKSTCTFGNPDSAIPENRAKPGQNWFSYGFFYSKDISVDVIPNKVADGLWQARVKKEIGSEPIVISATYKGKAE